MEKGEYLSMSMKMMKLTCLKDIQWYGQGHKIIKYQDKEGKSDVWILGKW